MEDKFDFSRLKRPAKFFAAAGCRTSHEADLQLRQVQDRGGSRDRVVRRLQRDQHQGQF